MIKLSDLLVTQSDVRDRDALDSMTFFVYTGGFWNHETLHKYARRHNLRTSPLIQISRFDDGVKFCHDGHHRCLAVYGGGREYLREDEYQISDWKYEEYTSINFDVGWVTPFDPRTHLRLADLELYKKNVQFILKEQGMLLAAEWVIKNTYMYRETRGSLTNVASLYEHLDKLPV